HPYKLPVIGQIEIYNQLMQEQVMQYYKSRYAPNNLTFIIVGDVDAEKVRQQLTDFFKNYSEKSLKPVFIPEEPPQLGRREAHQEFAIERRVNSVANSWCASRRPSCGGSSGIKTGFRDFSRYALKKSSSCCRTFSASTSPTTINVRLLGT